MDVKLSGEDGRKLCLDIKSTEHLKNIPVVLMSGSPHNLQDYKEFAADDILEKPFTIQTFLQKVDPLISKRRTTLSKRTL